MPAPSAPVPASRRRMFVAFGILFALALAVRLVLIFHMGNRYYFSDTEEYAQAARQMLMGEGPGREFPRAPLYPALMALGFALFGEGDYFGVRLLQLALGLGLVALCALAARRVGRPQHAVLAALFAGLAPTLVFTTGMLYPTVLYSLLVLGVTLVALDLDAHPGIARGALLGGLITLGWLTDQVIVVPVAAVLLWLAAGLPRRGWRLAAALAVALGVATLTALPVIRYYERAYGRKPVFFEKAQHVLWLVRNDPDVAGPRAVRDTTSLFTPLSAGQLAAREWHLLREQPVPYLSDYLGEFVHFFNPIPDRIFTQNAYTSAGSRWVSGLYFAGVLVLALAGLLAGAASRRDRLLLALVPLSTAALYALFFTQMRYRIPTETQMLVLAALGAQRLMPRLGNAIAGERVPADREPPGVAAGEDRR